MRYRLTRVGTAVALVAIVAGGVGVAGHNPATWAGHRLDDLRGTLVPVPGMTAQAVPPQPPSLSQYPGDAVADNRLDTAWAVPFHVRGSDNLECVPEPAGGRLLLLKIKTPTRIRAISVRAGLGADSSDARHHWRPETLQVDAGTWCERIHLADTITAQRISLRQHPITDAVRIRIVGAYPPEGGEEDQLAALTSVALLARPR